MDIISIKQLKVSTTLGAYGWEQQIQSNLFIDLDYQVDCSKVSIKDELKETIDYDRLCQFIQSYLSKESHQLLETLGERLIQKLLVTFSLKWVRLTIYKPGAIMKAQSVSLTLERKL